jgi:hypothetical protein
MLRICMQLGYPDNPTVLLQSLQLSYRNACFNEANTDVVRVWGGITYTARPVKFIDTTLSLWEADITAISPILPDFRTPPSKVCILRFSHTSLLFFCHALLLIPFVFLFRRANQQANRALANDSCASERCRRLQHRSSARARARGHDVSDANPLALALLMTPDMELQLLLWQPWQPPRRHPVLSPRG